MSSPVWPTRTLLFRLFPFTPWGALLAALAVSLLAVGALRAELASLIWGGGFLLLSLYGLAGSHLYGLFLRRHLRRLPDPLDCALPARGVFPGQEIEARISAEMPRLGVPGFQLQLLLPLSFPGRPALRLSCALQRGSTATLLRLSCPHRGCYGSDRALILIGDRLGFTRVELQLPLRETLRVYPSVATPGAFRPPAREGGERQRRSPRRPNHEELLEVRRYFPGDDIRRLHWKVFAHTRELFLRVGEDNPPPQTRFLVLLDACPSPAVPAELAADHLDGLVEACAAALLDPQAGGPVLFACSAQRTARPVARESVLELLAQLAGVCWEPTVRFSPGTAERGAHALLFSTPGSPNLPRLLRSLSEGGCATLLLLKGLPQRPRAGRAPTWRRLVLREPGTVPGPGRRVGPLRRGGGSELFEKAMQAALEHWRRRLKGKGHVRQI